MANVSDPLESLSDGLGLEEDLGLGGPSPGLPLSSQSQQPLSPLSAQTPFDIGSPMSAAVRPHDGPFGRAADRVSSIRESTEDEGRRSSISLQDEVEPAAASTSEGSQQQHPDSSEQGQPTVQLAADKGEASGPHPLSMDPLLTPAAALLDEGALDEPLKPGQVKISIKDPEKVELMSMGLVYGHYFTYLVRTEVNLSTSGPAAAAKAPASRALSPLPASPSPGTSPTRADTLAEGTLPSPAAAANTVEVRRRFSDFEALHRLLKARYSGYFIPPVPEKSFFDSQFSGDSFVKVRRVDLQAYMRSLAAHPVLGSSEELRVFLRCKADLSSSPVWQQWQQERGGAMEALVKSWASQPATEGASGGPKAAPGQLPGAAVGSSSGAEGAKVRPALFMRMKHSLMGVTRTKPKQEMPEEELQLRHAKELLKELQAHLVSACTMARSLVQHMEAVCEDFGGLAKSLSSMARFDEAAAQRLGQYTQSGTSTAARAAGLQTIGYASMRQHNLWKQFAMRCAASLVFLHDYAVLVPEAIGALEYREAVLAGVEVLTEELREKQAAAARLAMAGGAAAAGHDKKVAQLQAQMAQVQEQMLAAKQHYRQLAERNRSELARMNLEQTLDFHYALVHFAGIQAQLNQAAADIWSSVHVELQQGSSGGCSMAVA